MQGPPTPTKGDEAFLPTEHVSNIPHSSARTRGLNSKTPPAPHVRIRPFGANIAKGLGPVLQEITVMLLEIALAKSS
jgi:hypothetical protein